MIRLVILGAGTAIPVPGYSPAGYLVQIEKQPLLIDIGPGTLSRLAVSGVDYRDLDYVFITHHHSDHTLDLVTLIQANESNPDWKRSDPLHLIGSTGTAQLFEQLMATYPDIGPSSYQLRVQEIFAEKLFFPGWTVRSELTGHTSNSLGYRLEAEGKSIVFSGDAKLTPGLVSLANQADVFICECSFPGSLAAGDHLAAEEVGRLAQQAGVKRLVLVHMYPSALEADLLAEIRQHYSGHVQIGFDGLEILV